MVFGLGLPFRSHSTTVTTTAVKVPPASAINSQPIEFTPHISSSFLRSIPPGPRNASGQRATAARIEPQWGPSIAAFKAVSDGGSAKETQQVSARQNDDASMRSRPRGQADELAAAMGEGKAVEVRSPTRPTPVSSIAKAVGAPSRCRLGRSRQRSRSPKWIVARRLPSVG